MNALLRLLTAYFPETLAALAFIVLTASPLAGLGLFESLSDLHWLQSAKEMALGASGWTPGLYHQGFAQAPPLLIALMALFFKLFGAQMAAAQALTLLFALTALGATYSLALALSESRSVALMSAVMLGLSWGFFYASHVTPLSTASLAACLLTLRLFWWMLRAGERRQTDRRLRRAQSLLLGAHLGVSVLLTGLLGVGPALAIAAIFTFTAGKRRVLAGVHWGLVSAALAAILLPWTLLAFKAGLPPLFLIPETVSPTLRTLRDGLLATAPWTFLFAAALIASLLPLMASRGKYSLGENWQFLLIWLSAGALALPFLPLGLLAPLCVLTALTLLRSFEETTARRARSWAVDATALALMALAIFWTIGAFQTLPDAYPGVFWPLPGAPIIPTPEFLAKLSLPPVFPVWKVWLLLGPVLLIAAGGLYYLLTLLERPLQGLVALMVCAFAFYLFVNIVAVPAFARPTGLPTAAALRGDRQTPVVAWEPDWSRRRVRLGPADDAMALARARLLFALETPAPLPLWVVRESGATALESALRDLAARSPEGAVRVVMGQSDYYRLPFGLREQLRAIKGDGEPQRPPVRALRPDVALSGDATDDRRVYLLTFVYEAPREVAPLSLEGERAEGSAQP